MVFISFFGEPPESKMQSILQQCRHARPNYPSDCFGLTASLALGQPPHHLRPRPPSGQAGQGAAEVAAHTTHPGSEQVSPVGALGSERTMGPLTIPLPASSGNRPDISVGILTMPGHGSFLLLRGRVKVGSGQPDYEKCKEILQQWRQFSLPWAKVFPATPALEPGKRFCVVAKSLFAWTMNPLKILYVHHHPPQGAKSNATSTPSPPKTPWKQWTSRSPRSPRFERTPRSRRGSSAWSRAWDAALTEELSSRWSSRLPPYCRSRFAVAVQTLQGHFLAGEERFSVDWLVDDNVFLEIQSFSQPAHPLAVVAYPIAAFQQYQFVKQGLSLVRSLVNKGPKGPEVSGHNSH